MDTGNKPTHYHKENKPIDQILPNSVTTAFTQQKLCRWHHAKHQHRCGRRIRCFQNSIYQHRPAVHNKYFKEGNTERVKHSEFNSNNTELMTVEQVKEKLLALSYVQNELKDWKK